MSDIPDELQENKELFLADYDHSVEIWHPVSDCFLYRCMDKLDSVKPIGMPQGTANLIKPAKISVVDFEAIPVVAEKVKMWPSAAPQITRKEKPLETRTWCIRNPADAQ